LIYDNLNRLSEARQEFETTERLEPDYPGIHFYLGNIRFKFEEYRQALHHFRTTLESYNPEEILYSKQQTYLNLGLTYTNLEQPDSAQYIYHQAIRDDSTNAEAYMRIAREYKDSGEIDQALDYTLKAYRLNPTDPDYEFEVGTLYFQKGEMAKAVQMFKKAIRQMPWNYRAHYQLGQALMRSDQPEAAQSYLARADTLRGKLTEIVRLEQKTRQEPSNMMYWANLGEAYYELGDYSMARESLLMALSVEPHNLVLQNNLAHICMDLGRYQESISYFRNILHADSTLAQVWLNLGVAYAQADQLQQARHAWKTALELQPDNQYAMSYLQNSGGLP